MGNLYDGYMKLVDEVKVWVDVVIVSIFVNLMQFDWLDDLVCYLCMLQEDCEKLNKCKVDYVFVLVVEEIYLQGLEGQMYVDVFGFFIMLEGVSCLGYFCGVLIIVSKLFNLIQLDIVCFGEKDFQ